MFFLVGKLFDDPSDVNYMSRHNSLSRMTRGRI